MKNEDIRAAVLLMEEDHQRFKSCVLLSSMLFAASIGLFEFAGGESRLRMLATALAAAAVLVQIVGWLGEGDPD